MNRSEVITRAIKAYHHHLAVKGYTPAQPSNESDVLRVKGIDYVVLRNINGILAVYRINLDDRLIRLDETPEGLN